MTVYINKTDSAVDCYECGEPIESGDYFHIENKHYLCECCYEDAHEYDNE